MKGSMVQMTIALHYLLTIEMFLIHSKPPTKKAKTVLNYML